MATLRAEYKLAGKRVILRNAEPEDAAAMIALVNQFDTETDFLMREPGEFEMTLEQETAFLGEMKNAPNQLMLIAEVEGRIVGSTSAHIGRRRRICHAAGLGICITKPYWGIGLGRAMMAEIIGWLKSQQVEKVNLEVDTTNMRAISLYLRTGFTVEGTQKHQRRMADGSYRDSYWMTLFL